MRQHRPPVIKEGQLVVGTKANGMVFLTIPIETPGDIFFTAEQARECARLLLLRADEAERIRGGGKGAFHA